LASIQYAIISATFTLKMTTALVAETLINLLKSPKAEVAEKQVFKYN
jgi:hypothetical protein